jgi:hypothetical protein
MPVPSVVLPSRNVTVPVAPNGETLAVNITDCPEMDGLALEVTVVVVLALTNWDQVTEDSPKAPSPLYVATIEWVPNDRLEVVNVAAPRFSVRVPSVVLPSKNVTVPVAVDGDTVAVNVTACPTLDGLALEVSVVGVCGGLYVVVAASISWPSMYKLTETGTSLVGYGIEAKEAKVVRSAFVPPPIVNVDPVIASPIP